ncbi:hypothetical protein Halru_0649 [Halovivax ruber XH-70]|uniref:Uncharacterized protein n=1 Tax=Halovivax ruber (strain DSM 18193 / JCM 13892 / XH-70) TaxID=797302 RepID=L0IAL4_HALRX|nr:hypothetical protein [Halovivax ruber]AGB15276.1 hypothetical protein Halru_0649 [Halovivax ruber XH-70]
MDRSPSSPVTIERDGSTVRVGDDIERAEVRIEVDGEPGLEPAMPDLFLFPIDDAVSVTVSRMRLQGTVGRTLWDGNGTPVAELSDGRNEVPNGTYYASITGTVKIHLRIENAAVSAEQHIDDDQAIVDLRFDEPTSVAIGARSLRSHPSATITVPDDPGTLLEALPYLASSIKEFTCERSWPTLRQHPPAIERGNELHVPPELRIPETGVEIRIPPTYEHCYRVAPLAFYLGAELTPADAPELVLENGHVEPLVTERASLDERVADILSRCLLLDSLVRADGYQSLKKAEYDQLAPQLPFYPPNLYDLPLADQLLEYLDVPRDVLSPFLARWPKRAVLRPEPEDVSVLPSLLHELARIDVARSVEHVPPTVPAGESTAADGDPASGVRRPGALLSAHTFPDDTPGTCRLRPDAMEHGQFLERTTTDSAHLTLVTADPDRARAFSRFAERTDDEAVVSVLEQPTAAALHDALEADRTACYCELPATEDGIRCADRPLLFDAIDDVSTPVVWLAETPPEPIGDALVAAGSVAVVLTDGAPSPAAIRATLTQLLDGYSVADAAYTASLDREVDLRFVGDASVTVVRQVSNSPTIVDLTATGTDRYAATIRYYPTDVIRQGSVAKRIGGADALSRPLEESARDGYWLVGADAEQGLSVTPAEVSAFVDDVGVTVRLDNRLLTTTDDEALQTPTLTRGANEDSG